MTQYDQIAGQYDQSAEERSDRESVLVPSAKYYLGDLAGKSVLDLACGSGYFTRLIEAWGAETVVGADISAEMIDIARRRERENPLGIEYHVADASEMRKFGEFDIVFAGFLLHYSSSVEQLHMMCKTVSANLRSGGGRFVSFNESPFKAVHDGIKYGVEAKILGEPGDGAKIERTHYVDGKKDFSFQHHHYEVATYELALQSAGFSRMEWRPFVCRNNATSGPDFDYWREYLCDFSITVLLCTRD